MAQSPHVITFGCRLNAFESEVMRTHAKKAGLEDAIFINTCAVTAEAERQARQAIRKLKRENPTKRIIVSGCSAQIKPESYQAMPEVEGVLGNQEKLLEDSYHQFKNTPQAPLVSDIMSQTKATSPVIGTVEGQSRVYVPVQNGCDHRCTFCTIPFGRGNSRSVPMGHLFEQVKTYVDNGYQEIVLTGVDITSYGQDLPGKPTLGQMMRRLLAFVPDLPRLRLSSVDPVEIDEDVFELLATSPRFMPYLHISLQAGDDLILKRMKRRHLRPDLLKFCARARDVRPEVTFGADIIAGFPTEQESHFQNTFNILKECDITFAHIFPYSPRPGTPAARMPQVPTPLIKERAKKLRQEAARIQMQHFKEQIGSSHRILMEKNQIGRAENFMPVRVTGSFKEGSIQTAFIEDATETHLVGRILTEQEAAA